MIENGGSLSFNLQITQSSMLRLHAAMGAALERNEEMPINLQFKTVSRDANGGLNIVLEPSFDGRGQYAIAGPPTGPQANQMPNAIAKISKEIESGLQVDRVAAFHDVEDQSEANGVGEPNLSSRQWEVLDLLSQGCSNQDIASKLLITTNTAKSHVRNVMLKLHTGNRTQTALAARTLLKRA